MQLNFKLDVFEGPLDLLLHLISKHKLNINDIEISKLLEQYMDAIAEMKMADLEVTSEFLEMAARLVYIKTVSLLPRHEEADDLKKELTGQLLEYQACKAAAARLALQNNGYNIFVRQPEKIPIDKTYTREHMSDELLFAYLDVIGKAKRKLPPPASAFSGIVTKRMVSVTSRIIFVLRKLYNSGKVEYDQFFTTGDRSEMIATFLAMLELIKSKRITISDDNTYVYFDRTKRAGQADN
ncbi:MAG: segregation/condensation protein A [Clostridiales bacterium]|nr:segregation/condensation protein A [Clostridiales bacterium]